MARGNLPSSGPISFGLTSGEESSFNAFQDIKRAQSSSGQNTLKDFITWCASYVEPPGDPNNVLNGSAPHRFSETRNIELIGFYIQIGNETFQKYGDNNNSCVTVVPLFPNNPSRAFSLSLTDLGSTSITVNNPFTFNAGRAAVWPAGVGKTLTIQDAENGAVSCQISIIPGYTDGAEASVTGISAGGSGITYYRNCSTSPGASPVMYFYSGPRDPNGRPQG